MLSIAGGKEERGRVQAGRQAGQPCCISQAAPFEAGSKVGARKEASPPEALQLLRWTQKGEPDTGTLARDALHQPSLVSHAGAREAAPARLAAHPCSPIKVRLCQLELEAGGRQAGRQA